MAIFAQTFDANTVEPSNFDVFPAGKYLAQIVASEMRPTKDGRGQYLFLELDILEGPFAGRKLFDRLNLVNDNPDTVDIATRTLSSICRAITSIRNGASSCSSVNATCSSTSPCSHQGKNWG